MSNLISTLKQPIASTQRTHYRSQKTQRLENHSNFDVDSFLQGVIESLADGILILDCNGSVIHANSSAQRICLELSQNLTQVELVPSPIWHICQVLIDSRDIFPEQSIIIEDEISLSKVVTIRVRARWLELRDRSCPCLIVTLENRYESAKNMAIAEARKFGLTDRETEVWLLKRAGYTYKDIAAELHIAVDTVKKHLKNIHARRDALQWTDWID